MRGDASWCGTREELERLDMVARRYCTCGWPSPFRVGKPECDIHALLADQRALSLLLDVYRRRASLLQAELGGS
jgi:hypothetical protein